MRRQNRKETFDAVGLKNGGFSGVGWRSWDWHDEIL